MQKINYALIFFLVFLLNAFTGICQNVNIPDVNFKAALVGNSQINTNGDGEIQISEASVFSGEIDVHDMNIIDLTGIEAFINILYLNCAFNDLTNLDFSANTSLNELRCFNNQLTYLNVSVNGNLALLYCYNNHLTSLDLSTNTALRYLYCRINQLVSLDLSLNNVLTALSCSYNNLTNLSVKNGNNVNVSYIAAEGNPNLNCIEVDNAAFSYTNWIGSEFDEYHVFDDSIFFSENCTIGVNDLLYNLFPIYPNPATNQLTIKTENTDQTEFSIYDIAGRIIITGNFLQNKTIDISSIAEGTYFIQLKTKEEISTQKFIKQ